MRECFDRDGILLGWKESLYRKDGQKVRVFIPRREKDVARDRALIAGLFTRLRRPSAETPR